MKIIICDVCNEEIKSSAVITSGDIIATGYDYCQECIDKLRKTWKKIIICDVCNKRIEEHNYYKVTARCIEQGKTGTIENTYLCYECIEEANKVLAQLKRIYGKKSDSDKM